MAGHPLPSGDTLEETVIEQCDCPNGVEEALADPPLLHINWRVEGAYGHGQVVDIEINDVSPVLALRSEFASLFEKSGVDGLLGSLEATLAKLDKGDAANRGARPLDLGG